MKAIAKHRTHSIEFKRQIAQDFIAGETREQRGSGRLGAKGLHHTG